MEEFREFYTCHVKITKTFFKIYAAERKWREEVYGKVKDCRSKRRKIKKIVERKREKNWQKRVSGWRKKRRSIKKKKENKKENKEERERGNNRKYGLKMRKWGVEIIVGEKVDMNRIRNCLKKRKKVEEEKRESGEEKTVYKKWRWKKKFY